MEIVIFMVFVGGFTLGALSGSFITRRFYRRLHYRKTHLEFADKVWRR